MARKGAFTADDLDDIDELLQPSPPPAAAATIPKPPSAATITAPAYELPANGHSSNGPAPAAPKSARKAAAPKTTSSGDAGTKRPRTAPARTKAAQTIAEAHVTARVAEALRQLTHSEKQQRGKGRSYGEVVLDAIEEYETELRTHFQEQANAQPTGRLFRRVDQTRPRRRRHTEPPVKIPLAGIIAPDIELLDNLVIEWQAGSRSALVDEALKRYLAEEIAEAADEDDTVESAGE
ncbi:hypothetical protein ACFXG4_43410 [Nocardia sp. NPDC059246]|uniref:hypothetical protein n=1 Tax=unclassified Nocardia TaxID=2637762 RepID=UPI00368D6AF3